MDGSYLEKIEAIHYSIRRHYDFDESSRKGASRMYQAQSYILTKSAAQAYALLQEDPKNTVIGGGMWLRMGRGVYHTLIDISLLGLDQIKETECGVEIGAMVTLRQVETSKLLRRIYSAVFAQCTTPIVGVQFRNMATIGGTVCGRYGFSDIIPVLLALDAELMFHHAGTVSLEAHMAAPVRRDLLTGIRLPKDGRSAAYATVRNTATDYGLLNVCGACLADGSWRLVIGARPAAAVRCVEAEICLAADDPDGAAAAVRQLTYTDNLRAGGEYRRTLAEILTRRVYGALKGEEA